MDSDKIDLIASACKALINGDENFALSQIRRYPFINVNPQRKSFSPREATFIYMRDGFLDRYSGVRLINPAVLRVLSKSFPTEFPFQRNWKMSETHMAYWELFPTIDHVLPVARGGTDSHENLVTTSMLRNSAKSNWTLEELRWTLLDPGDSSKWDGLTGWLVDYVDETGIARQEQYVKNWYVAAKELNSACPQPEASFT